MINSGDVESIIRKFIPLIEAIVHYKQLESIAKKTGGKVLSPGYLGSEHHLEFQCKEGHIFRSKPANVKSGKWCPKCWYAKSADQRRYTIEMMHDKARSFGGRCLSKVYSGSSAKLTWRCKEGHTWVAVPGSVFQDHWCPECASIDRGKRRRLTIDEMQSIAKKRGGKCLSEEYVNANTPLEWRCKVGRTWKAIPNRIKRGSLTRAAVLGLS